MVFMATAFMTVTVAADSSSDYSTEQGYEYIAIEDETLPESKVDKQDAEEYLLGGYNMYITPVPMRTVIASGTVGSAPYTLYSDGTLEVGSGLIMSWLFWWGDWPTSPWDDYKYDINKIIFTRPTIGVLSLNSLFANLAGITTIEGLNYFDTRDVTQMWEMFSGASGLTSLDLSSWDTSNVETMSNMFSNMNSLIDLDLSGWDTRNVTSMSYMFWGTTSLRQLTLGTRFEFFEDDWGNAGLPAVPNNATYTGYWQNVGDGTTTNPQGRFVFTSAELMANYNGATMADTWVWQRRSQVPPEPKNGWYLSDGNMVFYQNGVRVGQDQAGPNGKYFAQNLVTPYGTADFLFDNQGHLLTGLRSYGNEWHYFHTTHGSRLLSGISDWWGWQLAPGQLRYLHADGTWAADELITITWDCNYGGLSQAMYLFDGAGFVVTDFDFDLGNGLSVYSAFGEWHVMATYSFNRVANFNVANGGGWIQPSPGVLRYLLPDGTYVTGPAVVVNGRTTIPAHLFDTAWTTISGHEFLFCVNGYLQFGWVYVDGVRVAFINASGVRTS